MMAMMVAASSTFCAGNWRVRESKVVSAVKRTSAVSFPGNSMEVKVAAMEIPIATRKNPKATQYVVRKPVEKFSDDRAGGFVTPFISQPSVIEDFGPRHSFFSEPWICVSRLDMTSKMRRCLRGVWNDDGTPVLPEF